MMWPADEARRWAVDRLVPSARNARTHSDAQVAQIAASIREWGWTVPVLVDENGNLIAGHGRVLAARATIAGVAVDDLSNPAAPVAIATWSVPPPAAGCGPVTVQLYDDGEFAAAAVAGGVYTLDLIEPSQVTVNGPAQGAGPAVRRHITPSILIKATKLERGRTSLTPLREGVLVCDRPQRTTKAAPSRHRGVRDRHQRPTR